MVTKSDSRYLLDMLAKVTASEKARGKRHQLSAILGIAMVALL